ncbi:cation transporter [Herminiimonas aquatilis]|uniref:Cation transporter n=1 Tax=Herminiimonas aquatilis TaxID=345342 RepID=A0ABW2J7B3_9BURK
MSNEPQEKDEIELDTTNAAQRRTLIWVLLINLTQAVVIGMVGWWANSTGLMGAALDNLADGLVYAVSIYAVGRSMLAKARAARLSALFLWVLAIGLLIEVIRRFVAGGEPIGMIMIIAAIANAATNWFCLKLLRSHRKEGVHFQSSWIFTANDMATNAGIALSGIAVMFFQSPLPDLLIGLVVVTIAFKGGMEIWEKTRNANTEEVSASDEKN